MTRERVVILLSILTDTSPQPSDINDMLALAAARKLNRSVFTGGYNLVRMGQSAGKRSVARKRAIRIVQSHQHEHSSQQAAILDRGQDRLCQRDLAWLDAAG